MSGFSSNNGSSDNDDRQRREKESNKNNDFLSNLRASIDEQQQQVLGESNDETINAGNISRKPQTYGGLEGLFDPSPPPPPPGVVASSPENPASPEERSNDTPDIIRAMRRGVTELPPLPPLAPNSNMYPANRKLAPSASMVTLAAGNNAAPLASSMMSTVAGNATGSTGSVMQQQQPLPTSVLISGKPSPIKHHHKRQVSWGVIDTPSPPQHDQNSHTDEDGGSLELPGSSLEQPSLEGTLNSINSTGGGGGGMGGSMRHFRSQSRARIMSLDDVLRSSPLEQEAETFILKALDDLHPQPLRQRSDTATSTIFTHQQGSIPESSSHDFSLDFEDTENGASNSDELDISASSSQDEEEDEEDEEEGIIKSTSNSSSQRLHRPRLHRRSVSVEQRLLGLTSAMAIQDTQSENDEKRDTGIGRTRRRKKSKSTVPTTIGVRQPQYEPVNVEDELAQNHTVLLTPSELDGWIHNDDPTMPLSPKGLGKQASVRNLATVDEADDEGVSRQDASDIEAQSSDGGSRRSERHFRLRMFKRRQRKKKHRSKLFTMEKLRDDVDLWRAFFGGRKASLYDYLKSLFLYVMLPATIVSAILFYFGGNPMIGRNIDVEKKASVSWWLLFFGVRQAITFSLALGIQSILIDFLSLSSKIVLKVFGPLITLFVVQSKGWPFVFFCWSILDFCSLYGDSRFAAHWAYWQELIDLFNDANPSGDVVNSDWNKTVLLIALSVSIVVALKRFVVGIFLGRATFVNYGAQLAKLMQKMLLLREVAKFAKEIERSATNQEKSPRHQPAGGNHGVSRSAPASPSLPAGTFGYSPGSLHGLAYTSTNDDASSKKSLDTANKTVIDTDARDPLTGNLRDSERIKIMQLLDQWEEPERQERRVASERSSISAVLRFRKALAFIQGEYPFSFAFGSADTREHCIESAQNVFNRLLLRSPGDEVVAFETIALLTENEDGVIDQDKAKDLMKLFRPDRQGNLTCLDFVKSVDAVYKRFRLLLASIENSSKIDRAFENIINVIFYIIVVTIILSQLGFDPLALFLSLSSVILAFAFMIGSASAKYFEGLLFIIVRRPYNVGDRIHVSDVQEDTPIEGAKGWVVENITLFETTAIWGPTNERCSLSNASLAYSRIINGARSPQAQIWVYLKFPIDTPYDKILIFKSAAEEYLKARPREWLSLNRFLAQDVVSDQGYVRYALVVQHRSSWQDVGQLLDSKANLSSYCQEVQRQLGMNYRAPPLPVDLKYLGDLGVGTSGTESADDLDSVTRREEFRTMALSRHNINLMER